MRRRGAGRRGPGLVGTAARTAVVVGTAQAVGGRAARRQEAAAAPAEAAAPEPVAAPPAGGLTDETIAQLKQLGELRDNDVLTDEEFAAQKAKLLG